jgi:hypothetical protein
VSVPSPVFFLSFFSSFSFFLSWMASLPWDHKTLSGEGSYWCGEPPFVVTHWDPL